VTYQPSILDEMDHYSIDRKCCMCGHFERWNSAPDRCGSKEMQQSIRDLTGVSFTALVLPVNHDTDASMCAEFLLSPEEAVQLEIQDQIDDARVEARRYADHYEHLRRTAHV